MKFVLGLVALVFIGLAVYVYTGKDYKQPQKQTVHKIVKEETPSQEAVTSVEKKVSEKVKPVVQHTVKKENLKVESTSLEVQNTSNSDGEIGEGLTLEGIESADVSDEEKERMRDDLAFYQAENVDDIEADKAKRKEIGKGLTLESIKNADVSDEEKERMLDDLAYFQTNTKDD